MRSKDECHARLSSDDVELDVGAIGPQNIHVQNTVDLG